MKRFIAFSVFAFLLIGVGVFLYTTHGDAQATPAVPTIDSLTADSACQITMNFSESSTASYFSASIKTTPTTPTGGSQLVNGPLTPPTPATYSFKYPDYSFEKNKTYYFALRAHSEVGGTSAWSAQKSVKTLDVVAPKTPVISGHGAWEGTDGTRTKISWTVPTPTGMTENYSGFRVYSSTDGMTYTADALTSTPEYYAIVDPTKPFYFKVKAYEAGLGCRTDTISTSSDGGAAFSDFSNTLVIPPVPKISKEEVNPSGSDWKIKLSWDKSTGATGYDVDLSSDSGFSTIIESASSVDTNFGSNKTFSSNITVYYRVRAKAGTTGVSNYTKGSVITGVPAPSDLAPSAYTFNRCTSDAATTIPVTFTWTDNASNNPRTIEFEQSIDGGTTYTNIGSYSVPLIEPDAGYSKTFNFAVGKDYKIRTYVSASSKQSSYSNVVSLNLSLYTPAFKLHGEAWMQTGGWLKLDPDGYCGVSADKNGVLHGEAWNPFFGWLSFDGDTSRGDAKINTSTGVVSGWARFIFKDQSVPGWDGWVSLRSTSTISYGVCLGDTKDITGVFSNGDTFGTGNECKGNGSTSTGKMGGMMWGGPTVGGWIVFPSAATQVMKIEKDPDGISYAPRERVTLSTKPLQNATWMKLLTEGSGDSGTLNPLSGVSSTLYTAPIEGKKTVLITASSSLEIATTSLKVTEFPYELHCSSLKGSVRVDWTKEWLGSDYLSYANHTLALSYSTTSPSGPWKIPSPVPTPSAGTGFFDHKNLATSTTYYYRLEAKYSDKTYTMITTAGCMPSTPVVDNPSRLSVFAQDVKTMLLNWKDNATTTGAYTFDVQRIKLTPASSTSFAVSTTTPVLSTVIPLTWKNISTTTPFYQWVERSSSTLATKFSNPNKKDPIYPGCSIAGDSTCKIDKIGYFSPTVDKSVTPKKFTGQLTPFTGNVNVGRDGEGTTFFLRIRACSQIEPKYTTCDQTQSGCVLNLNYRPNPACSIFTATSSIGKIIATTTPPLPVIEATTTKAVKVTPSNPYTKYKTTVSWKDDSLREMGVIVQRSDGTTAVESGGKIIFQIRDVLKKTLDSDVKVFGPYGGRGTPDSFEDETLEAGTTYTYIIRPFIEVTDPVTDTFARVISPIQEAGKTYVQTPYRVVVATGGDGSDYGYVTENSKGLDSRYPQTRVADFEPNEQAVVEYHYVEPDGNDYADFTSWSGISCNQEICDTQRTGTVSATANFTKYCYSLSAGISPSKFSWCAQIDTSGQECTHSGSGFERGTTVDVNITNVSSTCKFTGWSGSCWGTGSCSVLMNTDRSVYATFTTTTKVTIFGLPRLANIKNSMSNLPSKISSLFAKNNNVSKNDSVSIRSFTANAFDAIKSFAEEVRRMFLGVSKTDAASTYEDYFVTANTDPLIQPSFKDINLEPDTIYFYRVGIRYAGDSIIKKWSLNKDLTANETAGKTLPEGSIAQGGSYTPICTRNSYCDFSSPKWKAPDVPGLPTAEYSEKQCVKNLDCVDVGRKRQTTEEQ